MTRRARGWWLVLVGSSAMLGCGTRPQRLPVPPEEVPADAGVTTPDAGQVDAGPITSGPTFYEDVLAVFQERCIDCHRPGGIGPFSLHAYELARAFAPRIVEEVQSLRMPPWGARASEACAPPHAFVDDPSLSEEELELIARWAEAGAPAGDPSKAPPHREPRTEELVGAQLRLEPPAPWTVSGRRDQFRCFVLDPGFGENTYVNGVAFEPDNPQVVHHAIVFLDPGNASAGRADASGSYECFGGPGFSDTQVLLAWAPGAGMSDLPSHLAYRLPAGAKLVLQVHYHPLASGPQRDRSAVRLRTTTVRPDWLTQVVLIGNFEGSLGPDEGLLPGMNDRGGPEFRVPAGARDHVEEMAWTLPAQIGQVPIPDLRIINVGTHMHYVGTDMRWHLERAAPRAGEAASECMVHTPEWNFEWQRGYTYDIRVEDAPQFRPGDRLRLRCAYDNSMENPFVAAALREQGLTEPQDVFLGEETLDEMCLAVFTVAYPNPF